jgi:hypothetical protein
VRRRFLQGHAHFDGLTISRHSPYGRRFKPKLRLFGVSEAIDGDQAAGGGRCPRKLLNYGLVRRTFGGGFSSFSAGAPL